MFLGALTAFLRADAPAWERITDVRIDPPALLTGAWRASNAWLLNVKFVIVPTEDLLAPATPQDARTFQTMMGELDALSRWNEAYTHSSYATIYPALQVQMPPRSSPQLLSVVQPKGRPLTPTYGKLTAEWQVDHWNFGDADINLPETGQPRAHFPGSTLVLGSPEAEHLMAAAKAIIAQVQPQKAVIEQNYRTDLLKATGPGALYKGQIRHHGSTVPVALLNITRHYSQPFEVTLHVQEGRLEGRLNGFVTDSAGFALSTQQSP